ncbi:MAG: hypothetical protein V2A34_12330 [Lentisphaerota bacterium]
MTFSLASSGDTVIYAADLQEEESFMPENFRPAAGRPWAIGLKGLLKLMLGQMKGCPHFHLTFTSNLSVETGHSNLAALEIAAALVYRRFLGLDIPRQELARFCQKTENDFLENPCGLMDSVTGLFAGNHSLLFTDYLTLESKPMVPSHQVTFFLCSTGPRRATWKDECKKRREQCEGASAFFAKELQRPIQGLRDVTMTDWMAQKDKMDPVMAARAAHVIGENDRVRRAAELMREGNYDELGLLMHASHESSMRSMENSIPEINYVVEQSHSIPGILGARLSGGGFGGSALLLAKTATIQQTLEDLSSRYAERFGSRPDIHLITPSPCGGLYRAAPSAYYSET